jgi:hypothetical protein
MYHCLNNSARLSSCPWERLAYGYSITPYHSYRYAHTAVNSAASPPYTYNPNNCRPTPYQYPHTLTATYNKLCTTSNIPRQNSLNHLQHRNNSAAAAASALSAIGKTRPCSFVSEKTTNRPYLIQMFSCKNDIP